MVAMTNEKQIPLLVLSVSVLALGMALTAQHVFELQPCILCIYQRIPYVTAGLLAVLALMLPVSLRVKAAIIAVCGAAFLVNVGIATYHVGVEQQWWTSSCAGQAASEMTLQQMMADLERRAEKPCDVINWTFLGFSMATWNVPFSFMIGVATLFGARRMFRSE